MYDCMSDLCTSGQLGDIEIFLLVGSRNESDGEIDISRIRASSLDQKEKFLHGRHHSELGGVLEEAWKDFVARKIPPNVKRLDLCDGLEYNAEGVAMIRQTLKVTATAPDTLAEVLDTMFQALFFRVRGTTNIPYEDVKANPSCYYDTDQHGYIHSLSSFDPKQLELGQLYGLAQYVQKLEVPFVLLGTETTTPCHSDSSSQPPENNTVPSHLSGADSSTMLRTSEVVSADKSSETDAATPELSTSETGTVGDVACSSGSVVNSLGAVSPSTSGYAVQQDSSTNVQDVMDNGTTDNDQPKVPESPPEDLCIDPVAAGTKRQSSSLAKRRRVADDDDDADVMEVDDTSTSVAGGESVAAETAGASAPRRRNTDKWANIGRRERSTRDIRPSLRAAEAVPEKTSIRKATSIGEVARGDGRGVKGAAQRNKKRKRR